VRDWDMVTVGGLPGGERHLEGVRTSVTYGIVDPARRPPGQLVQRNFLNALKAIGAKILTAEDDQDRLVAMQATAAGETWYVYAAGGGSSETRTSYTLTTLAVGPFVQEVAVRAMAEGVQPPGKACADPPWLAKQFASYKLGGCDYQDFAPLKVKLPDGERSLVGRVLSANYGVANPHHVRIAAAVWRNYVTALQAVGAKLVSDPKDMSVAVLTQTVGPGEYWYIYRMANGNADAVTSFALQTLQIGGPPPKACTMEVYGVNFDFDKAVLRPDSEPVLNQVLALFTGTPEFAAEVGGHTDNIGKPPYNLTLSDGRAAAVKSWLVAHGVAAGRVSSHGYGDTQPLVPNTTDENRFKNRRVELKRANCKVAG
jgi:outer membrane protein OmpA-like peptidoglycan-associated protein